MPLRSAKDGCEEAVMMKSPQVVVLPHEEDAGTTKHLNKNVNIFAFQPESVYTSSGKEWSESRVLPNF